MAVIKCKMCGGDMEILEDSSVCECEYCGTRQTVPKADDEKKLKLFARAGRLLRACEFDKAAGVYETIVADFDQEAEAYWGLILCKYGIEYVDDPATGKKIPTCHRSSFDGVLDDANFDLVMENADAIARPVYRAEAKEIERLRKGILEVSAQEEPYDVFICYKETDEQGDRTVDSLIAQDVYTALTERGYRVFFSRISLEDKLGQEYEPYIFAALHSARVMLAFGTSYENYDAVWVKNEWSRFLSLIARGEKKTLIPCYKDLDAYDMPKEFQRLQAQDMGKVGAMQDLLRGVEKIIGKKKAESAQPQPAQQVVQGGGPNVAALLERGNMALEDQEWEKAKGYFDQVLSMDAKNAQAYLGLAMVEAYAVDRDLLADLYTAADSYLRREENKNIARARKFDKELNTWFAKLDQKGRQKDQKQQLATNKEAKQLESIRGRYAKAAKMIAAGWSHTVGLKADGTVIVTGSNNPWLEVCNWRDIAAISEGLHYGSEHIVGLKNDGTVVAVGGKMNWGQCDVGEWRNIVAISAGYTHTVGLKADGTVVAVGLNSNGECDINEWHDIVAVSAGDMHTVGLKKDGTVITAGADYRDCCKVDSWSDIVAVAAGHDFTLGLTSKGTVLRTGWKSSYSLWNDIVAIAAGDSLAVGLKKDGTVVTQQFSDREGKCDVSSWHDIVAIAAGSYHIAGLKADGTVIAQMCQYNTDSNCRCVVGDWKLFNDIDTLEDERKAAAERAKAEAKRAEAERRAAAEKAEAERRARIAALNKEKDNLQIELNNLRGLFTGKRRREIEARLAEIDAELKKLG